MTYPVPVNISYTSRKFSVGRYFKKKEKRAWNDLEKVVGHRDVTKIIAAVCCELVISFSRCYAEGAPGLAANFNVTLVHQDGNK